MEIILFSTPRQFLEENHSYLATHEVTAYQSILSALAQEDNLCSAELLFGKVVEQNSAVLLFSYHSPRYLYLNAIDEGIQCLHAVKKLAGWLKQQHKAIQRIVGQETLCREFLIAWEQPYHLQVALDAMILQDIKMKKKKKGILRPATFQDEEFLAQWLIAFNWEAGQQTMPIHIAHDIIQDEIRKNAVYIFDTPEKGPVFTAYFSEHLPHGTIINGVYTAPCHRNQGYCQWAMALLCQQLLKQGNDYVALFVDKTNPISNRAYKNIGFEILEDQFYFQFT